MTPASRRALTVSALGTAQTLSWASSYYLPAMLAAPIARDLGAPSFIVFAAFSLALVVSAALGPFAGKAIDRFGGRPVLMGSNLVFAAGLLALSQAASVPWLMAAWVLIGVAMGSGLYEAAFATVVRIHGADSRGAITGITLFAGFASTVGWPLTAFLEAHCGWRGACMAWAGLHLVLGLPLNAIVPRVREAAAQRLPEAGQAAAPAPGRARPRRTEILLAYVFAVGWFVSTAMAAHLPSLLHASGVSAMAAVSIAALVGPAQVAGRLLEFGFLRRAPALLSARIAALAHPLGVAALLMFGAPAAMVFAVLHGAGNGILTIAVGTLPLLLFGPQGYGGRQGLLMVPARLLQAGAPFLFGLLVQGWGERALWASAFLGLTAAGALMCISVPGAPRSDRR
ncbi:MFS transporter [Variovorax paradoxus]|uniref:Multidrug resistance protein MdtL n=1 Tax=Variovorax paradoxus TaxID=34073 RepID=A0A0H2M232_VARPD|nr:MFS transporter [Variovorax paradoxus]KLN56463.1 multidrug resistance protein MdtL [Variovorax paradoxus]